MVERGRVTEVGIRSTVLETAATGLTHRKAFKRPDWGGTMFSIIGWILFGLVVGIIAKLLMPGRDPGGFVITILLGIAGALLGGFIGRAIGLYGPGQSAGFFMALLGAIILLAVYRLVAGRSAI